MLETKEEVMQHRPKTVQCYKIESSARRISSEHSVILVLMDSDVSAKSMATVSREQGCISRIGETKE